MSQASTNTGVIAHEVRGQILHELTHRHFRIHINMAYYKCMNCTHIQYAIKNNHLSVPPCVSCTVVYAVISSIISTPPSVMLWSRASWELLCCCQSCNHYVMFRSVMPSFLYQVCMRVTNIFLKPKRTRLLFSFPHTEKLQTNLAFVFTKGIRNNQSVTCQHFCW